jgi:DNA-binding transcriptional LysR family regulator
VILGRLHVLPQIESCLEQWPMLSIDATFSDRLVDLIDEGFDMVVRIGFAKEDSRLLSRTVGYQRMVACASPRYLESRQAPQVPAELTDLS